MTAPSSGSVDLRPENAALQEVLAAEHAAVWGYGVVGDALPAGQRDAAQTDEAAHRDSRDVLAELLDARRADPVPAKAAYALPSPVHSMLRARWLMIESMN